MNQGGSQFSTRTGLYSLRKLLSLKSNIILNPVDPLVPPGGNKNLHMPKKFTANDPLTPPRFKGLFGCFLYDTTSLTKDLVQTLETNVQPRLQTSIKTT